MKYLLSLILLSGCVYSKPGTIRLIQCGRITGCETIHNFDSQETCDNMMKQMQSKDITWSYTCDKVK